MMRAACAIVTLLSLALPSSAWASGALLDGGPRRIVTERPSRRLVRQQARAPLQRNPALLTITELPLDASYENRDFGLALRYPSAWLHQDVMERSPPLTLVMMFLSGLSESGIRQNVNLVIEDLPHELSLDEYTELGIETERELFEEFVVVDSVDIPFLGSERAHRIIFTAPSNGRAMAFAQLWIIRGKRAFVWTFADAAETFTKNYPTFERMMDTLTMR